VKSLPNDVWEALELDPETWDSRKIAARIAVEARYRGYIERETAAVNNLKRLEEWKIPDDFDYDTLKGLRNESRMKLKHVKPTSLAQASRIDGVTPAETALLQVHLKRRARQSDDPADGRGDTRPQTKTQALLEIIQKASSAKSIAIFIGPEGDFTNEEYALAKQHGCIPVSLGKTILKVETAALCVLSCANIFLRKQ